MSEAVPDSLSPETLSLGDKVRYALKSATEPLALKEIKTELIKVGVPFKGKSKVSDADIQRELESEGIYAHPVGKGKPKYWYKPPLTAKEVMEATIKDKLAGLGEGLATLAQLGKPSGKAATSERLAAFETIVARLLDEGKLFKAGAKYTTKAPPITPWYESAVHKAEYNKLTASVGKLVKLGNVTLEQIVAALRKQFADARDSPPPPNVADVPPVDVPPPQPSVAPSDLRHAVREAYDYLCLFTEFRDKLVELPRLYHEAVKRMTSLTVEAFHNELWQLRSDFAVELHVLNEVRTAVEPHLAIFRNDRLYYYARWK